MAGRSQAERDPAAALELLRRHGREVTAFQILEAGIEHWFHGPAEAPTAVVGYVRAKGHWVAAGAPVAPLDQVGAVAGAFVGAARAAGCRAVFFAVDPESLDALHQALDCDSVQIGEQADFDPAAYGLGGRVRRSLRQQVRRAANKGVQIRRVAPDELARHRGPLRAEIAQVMDRWLASRRMSVMRFMVDLEPFTFPESRRYYVAERDDEAVGFLAAVPVHARGGWFLEDVIRTPSAPNGTAEALIDAALRDVKGAGEGFASLGLAPLAGVPGGPGPHPWLRRGLRACYRWLGPLYSFSGVRAFKQRFRPTAWTPIHLVACPGPVGVRSFHAVLSAFAGGGLVRFAADSFARLLRRVSNRVWAGVVATLGALLVPWTWLLASADGERWFGDVSIQRAWVVFDSVFVVALCGLAFLIARRHPAARTVSLLLAGATFTDFVLSTVQAVTLHGAVSGWAALFVAAGLAGPLLATAVLGAVALVVDR